MVSPELIDYIKKRIDNKEPLTNIKDTLKNENEYDDNEFLSAIDNILSTKNSNQKENNSILNTNSIKNQLFVHSLLVLGTIALIITGTINDGRNKFPQLIGFLMISTAVLFYIGVDKLKKIAEEIKRVQKENKRKL